MIGDRCTSCAHAVLRDVGYSNYTVEGIDIDCTLDLNPDFPREVGWIEDPDIRDGKSNMFAEQCPSYLRGTPTKHDVECPYDCRACAEDS